MSEFYVGCKIFEPISQLLGISVDQINFFLCMISACCGGVYFKTKCSPEFCSPQERHFIAMLGGFSLASFCFGYQVIHLILPCIITYMALCHLPLHRCAPVIMVFSMGYLSIVQICRMYLDYGGYTLDITGPLMVLVQRISTITYNLYDGELIRQGKPLRKERHRQFAVLERPGFLEFFSYCLNFQTIMVGPFIYYNDYEKFITGKEADHLKSSEEKFLFNINRDTILDAKAEIRRYIIGATVHGLFFIFVLPKFPIDYYLTDEFHNQGPIYKFVYMTLTTPIIRQQYYFAWSLASLTCLYSGLGFCGFDENQRPIYTIVKNMDLMKIEFANSFKMVIDGWNITTASWLRICVYERLPSSYATPVVFLVSAMWHGFYPGYYLFFISNGFFTQVGRVCRRYLRPWFIELENGPNAFTSEEIAPHDTAYSQKLRSHGRKEESESASVDPYASSVLNNNIQATLVTLGKNQTSGFYDLLTTVGANLVLNYSAIAFVMLDFWKSMHFFKEMYFAVHIGALALYLIVPRIMKSPQNRRAQIAATTSCSSSSSTSSRTE